MATAATIDVLLRANTAAYRASMAEAARTGNQNLASIRKSANETAVSIANLNRAAVAFVGFQSAKAGVSALVEARKEYEALHNSLRGATGSTQAAEGAYGFVAQAAKDLGLDLRSAAQGFTQLTASATPMGVAVGTQRDLFIGLSRAATAMHLSTDSTSRAITALSQSFGKGKFQAEELRQQLGEAIPGVVPRFQQAVLKMTEGTDLAGKSFDQLLQGGLLDAKTFAPAMVEALNGMSTGYQEASRSIQAESNKLGNAWMKMKQDMAEGGFSDTVAEGLRLATSAVENMNTVLPVATGLLGGFATIKMGERASAWASGLKESHNAMLLQARSAEKAAAALVNKTRVELADAQAAVRKAAAYGGSLAAEVNLIAAERTHAASLKQLEVAQNGVAAASSRMGLAAKTAMGFFGGPVGLALMVATTAASWLAFRDNTVESDKALIDFNGTASESIEKFRELNRAQQAGQILRLSDEIQASAKGISEAVSLMSNEGDFTSLYESFGPGLKKLQSDFSAGRISADQFADSALSLTNSLAKTGEIEEVQRRGLVQYAEKIGTTAREIEHKKAVLAALNGENANAAVAAGAAADAIRRQAGALNGLGNAAETAGKKVRDAIAGLPGQIARIGKSAGDVARLDVGDWYEALQKQGVNFNDRDNAQVQEYIRQGAEYIRLTKQKAASEKAWNEQLKETKAAARDALSYGKEQASQYTSMIDRIQRQIALDREQMGLTGDMIPAQRLQVTVLTEMKSAKDKLSEVEKARVRTMLAEAVAQGQVLAAQQAAKKGAQELLKLQMELQESAKSRDASNFADLYSIGHSSEDVERMRRQAKIQEDAQARFKSLNDRNQSGLTDWKTYLEQFREIEKMRDADLAAEKAYQAAKASYMADYSQGVSRAFGEMQAAAADFAGQTYSLLINAFSAGEDAFVEFVKTSKLSFSELADSIISDLARIAYKQMVTGLFSGMTGANTRSDAGSLASLMGGSFMGYDTGGYTGPGGRKEPAGIVHKGEGVLNQDDIAALGGEAGFNRLRRQLRRGYDLGGVGGQSPGIVSLTRGAGPTAVNINVVNAPAGTTASATANRNASGGLDIEVILNQFLNAAAENVASGGSIGQAGKGRYGWQEVV